MSEPSHTGFHKPYFIVTWVEFGISIFLLAPRCYTSLCIVKYTASDLSLAVLTFQKRPRRSKTILNSTEGHYALLYGWLNQFLALIAIGLGNLTIAAFLQQIQGYHTIFRTVLLWSSAGSNFIVNCIAAVLLIVQCDPIQTLWDHTVPGDCSGQKRVQVFGYVQGTWSAFCDFALALFPILLFARIRVISLPTRIELSLLMGSGVVAGACAIVKTIRLGRLTTFTDATHQLGHLIVWNQTEMWVVFIVSCLPPTKVFFARLFDKVVNWVSFIFSQSWPRSPGEDVLRYL